MTPELETLARRAVACKRWRWMRGMLAIIPAAHEGATGYTVNLTGSDAILMAVEAGAYPDLTDPATLGCLLALVREAWNDSTLGVSAARGGRSGRPARAWSLKGRKPYRKRFINSIASAFFGSETNALVTALEAAP